MASVTVESMSSPAASSSNRGDVLHRSSITHTSGTPTVNMGTEANRPPRTSSMYAAASPVQKEKTVDKEHGQTQEQPIEWGRNFWVTLVDPQSQAQFYACPSTGQTTWDAPVGNFVLPPSSDGEWWELRDETRGGIPYYYHTKSGDTTWNKPDGFVIPLGVIQDTTLGRRLSQSTRRHSHLFSTVTQSSTPSTPSASAAAHSTPSPRRQPHPSRRSTSHASPPSIISERTEEASGSTKEKGKEKDRSDEEKRRTNGIQPSAYATSSSSSHQLQKGSSQRSRSKSSGHPSAASGAGTSAQSLTAAVELIASAGGKNSETASASDHGAPHSSTGMNDREREEKEKERRSRSRSHSQERRRTSIGGLRLGVKMSRPDVSVSVPNTPISISKGHQPASPLGIYSSPAANSTNLNGVGKSPRRPIPAVPSSSSSSHSHSDVGGGGVFWRQRRDTSAGNGTNVNIGRPILNAEATRYMSPVLKNVNGGMPIPVTTKRLSTGEHPLLPRDLVSEIQQFAKSDYARRYFSTHREGLIFRRRVPVERMMMWQKAPMTSPLLVMNRTLHKDAVRAFKVIQRIMGDRDRDRPVGVRHTESSSSLQHATSSNALLEEERWLLGEGVLHGEMRDEIYCQVIKQLSGNHNTESTFRGWQLMCVLLVTFPPSKNFEPYVRAFMQQRTTQSEGRVDVMAKYCLQRLAAIAKKGPRGKPPTIAEIENASDAAFNPSTFGESLDAILRLQERTYADLKVPVILPFLADGILALGGTKQQGIFRVPGDADAVSELRLRIDKGVYTLDGIDDPHVPASLLKLWLRELLNPLVPEEMYNECVACANEPERVVAMVGRLPTIHRRVLLFVISFLQLFLEERVQQATKMTSANLALVMAPNILRCNSDSMSVVFTNATYEHKFVHHLLVHLRCDQVDPGYVPGHGKGAGPTPAPGRKSHQKSRRPKA